MSTRAHLLLLLIVAMATFGCRTGERPSERRPDVFVYLVDTLRRDHLGVYGYGRATSPRLDAFAKDAVVFENAYAPSSWTKASTASLLTGLLPRRHGAIRKSDRLPSRIETAAERLAPIGYHTAAFVTNPNVIPLWGFDQGFADFRDLRVNARPAKAPEVVRTVLKALEDAGDDPVFFYIHTIEPHTPNNPPEPFASMWPRRTTQRAQTPKVIRPGLDPDLLHDIVANYDAEIAFADAHFGELLDGLRASGRYDNALFVYVSDHGEELGDHGGGGHGHTLYEELLRVPLLVKYPGNRNAGRRIPERVSLNDMLPTILAALGEPVPPGLDGNDLAPVLAGEAAGEERALLFDLDLQSKRGVQHLVQAVLVGGAKYVERFEPRHETELFDLANDPAERTNRAPSDPGAVAELSSLLERWMAELQGGIHVRFVNEGDRDERTFSGRLTTEGRFLEARSWQFESGDRVNLSDDGRSLEFAVRSRNRENQARSVPRWLVDEDGITFRVEPMNAKVVFEALETPGFATPRIFVGGAQRVVETLPLEIAADDPAFVIDALPGLLPASDEKSIEAPGGTYVVAVPYTESETSNADAETTERLRALGYVQ